MTQEGWDEGMKEDKEQRMDKKETEFCGMLGYNHDDTTTVWKGFTRSFVSSIPEKVEEPGNKETTSKGEQRRSQTV